MAKKIDKILEKLGFVPYENKYGTVEPYAYCLEGYQAPVYFSYWANVTKDGQLTIADDMDEIDVLKEALKQLSERVDNTYQQGLERDLLD